LRKNIISFHAYLQAKT